jgi:hypothetical protein
MPNHTKRQTDAKPTYMQEVQTWLDGGLYPPLRDAIESGDDELIEKAFANASRTIKQRLLASYHNGRKGSTQ